ncbi:HSP20 family protein [Candidatus Magnetomoraceae bacterium gMMP-15]
MSIVRWEPFRGIVTLQDRINRVFDDVFTGSREVSDDIAKGIWKPVADIYEMEDNIVVKAELPGLNKEDVSVEIKDNVLSLKGERSVDNEVKDKNYYRKERSYGSFQRSFTLPHSVDPDSVKAKFKDGLLEVEIPKPEKEKPKEIKINIE